MPAVMLERRRHNKTLGYISRPRRRPLGHYDSLWLLGRCLALGPGALPFGPYASPVSGAS